MCFIALDVTEGAMRIISRKTAAARADVHERTLDRLHSLGLGPPRIQLSRRRVGYDDESFDDWLRSRAFASMAAAHAARTGVDSDELQDQRPEPQQTRPHAVSSQRSTPPAVPQPVSRGMQLLPSAKLKSRRKDEGPPQDPLPMKS
jgi:hypothetical protein